MSYLCRQLPLLHQQLLDDAAPTIVTRRQQVEKPHTDIFSVNKKWWKKKATSQVKKKKNKCHPQEFRSSVFENSWASFTTLEIFKSIVTEPRIAVASSRYSPKSDQF